MSLRQVGLLTAGAQPWSPRMCAASGNRFAYCSTLAIYIYEWDSELKKFNLHSVVSAHKKTITCISWNPRDPNVIASASTEKEIILWDISDQRISHRMKQIKETPVCLEWCPHEKDVVSFIYGCGPLFLWNSVLNQEVTSHKESFNFYSDVTQFSWNQKRIGKIAFGHKDGSLSFVNHGHKPHKQVLRPENLDEEGDEDSVQVLQWDSLSPDFLLVAYKKRTGIRLIDTESIQIIMNFKLPSAAAKISGFSWIDNAPGMFVSGDSQSGVLRVWSVSKDSPILNIKVKETGFHSISVIPESHSTSNSSLLSSNSNNVASSTSLSTGKSSSSSQSSLYQIPPAHVVCTFLDGGIGLYDIGKERWDFLRDYGHIETIFDCKFHPDDPDLLATCSFDGTIKVWNIQTVEAVKSTARNETAIYSISWAPGDLNCLVAATSRSGCFVWDVEKERIIMRFNEHGKNSVYTASWNQKDSKYIASSGADGNCIIRMVDGTVVKKYKHPGSVFGCDWSPNNSYGDLVPQTKLTRIVGMMWMIVGMVSLSLFAGKLTTALTVAQTRETKLYGQEVAAIHDSVAHTIAIRRNANVNTKASYQTIEQVAAALKRREVKAALVDVASAAAQPELFKHSDIQAVALIEHPFSYGMVLSEDMSNAADTFRDFIKVEQQGTLKALEKSTAGFKVKKEPGPLLSLIHYKSPIFKFALIIVASLLSLAVAYGLVNYYREREYKKEMRAISLKHNFKELQDPDGGIILYSNDAVERHEQLQEYGKDAICAMERKVGAITEDRMKRHPGEILKYLENPEDVPSRHVKWIREQRTAKQEMRERRRHAWVPETYVAGRSDEDIDYVMPADALVANKPPPSLTKKELIDYWSKHQLEKMAAEQKLQQMKRDFDPNPKAIAGPSGQQAVYVDISSEE